MKPELEPLESRCTPAFIGPNGSVWTPDMVPDASQSADLNPSIHIPIPVDPAILAEQRLPHSGPAMDVTPPMFADSWGTPHTTLSVKVVDPLPTIVLNGGVQRVGGPFSVEFWTTSDYFAHFAPLGTVLTVAPVGPALDGVTLRDLGHKQTFIPDVQAGTMPLYSDPSTPGTWFDSVLGSDHTPGNLTEMIRSIAGVYGTQPDFSASPWQTFAVGEEWQGFSALTGS